MDQFDQASEFEARYRDQALAAQRQASHTLGESLKECEDCGEPISEARRQACQGCIRCLTCQEIYEGSTRGD